MSDIFGEGKAEHGQHAFEWVLMVINPVRLRVSRD